MRVPPVEASGSSVVLHMRRHAAGRAPTPQLHDEILARLEGREPVEGCSAQA
jgi:hypothetical protein